MAGWDTHSICIPKTMPLVREFGLRKPAFRICVNTPAALGAVGYTTNLFPAMTLGCGAAGGNITSDNISPMHLINLKRVAYGVRDVVIAAPKTAAAGAGSTSARRRDLQSSRSLTNGLAVKCKEARPIRLRLPLRPRFPLLPFLLPSVRPWRHFSNSNLQR